MSPQNPDTIHRRQLLTAAATMGVAPWLLSACAATSDAARASATGQSVATRSTTKRRLGPLVGVECSRPAYRSRRSYPRLRPLLAKAAVPSHNAARPLAASLYRRKRRAKRRRTCHEPAVAVNAQKRANTKSTPATVVSAGPSAVNANQARSAAPATEGAFMMTAAAQIHPGRAKEAALRIRCSAWLLTS